MGVMRDGSLRISCVLILVLILRELELGLRSLGGGRAFDGELDKFVPREFGGVYRVPVSFIARHFTGIIRQP